LELELRLLLLLLLLLLLGVERLALLRLLHHHHHHHSPLHYTHTQLFTWNGVIKSNSQIYCCGTIKNLQLLSTSGTCSAC